MTSMRLTLGRARRRLIAYGFELLYNDLAWLYDPVSWIVSRGMWRKWQQAAWPYLPPDGRILDAGCGPGHLLTDLADGGCQPVGLDLSPAMLRLAKKGLQRREVAASLCRGRVQALPFAPQSFAAIISSFPTAYVYDRDWMYQAHRVLKRGGRLVIIEAVSFPGKSLHSRWLEWLYRVTGQRAPAPDLLNLLTRSNLPGWRETVEVEGSTVEMVLAIKR